MRLEKTIRLADGTKVTLRGDEEDDWSLAVWTAEAGRGGDAISFAVCAGGEDIYFGSRSGRWRR